MTTTMWLYGDIGWENTDISFARQMEEIAIDDDVLLAINSPGGDVFQAQAMASIVEARIRAGGVVNGRIDGLAASAASFLPMSVQNLTIARGGWMMVHKPMAYSYGNANEFLELVELLDKIEAATIIPAYARRTGMEVEKIAQMLSDETWINADEAVEMGFVDGFSDVPAVEAKIDSKFKYRKVPEAFRNASKGFKERLKDIEDQRIAGIANEVEAREKARKSALALRKARLRLMGLV